MRVMESRFSTMRMSHCESSLMSCSSSCSCGQGICPFCSRIAVAAPLMPVSGVRRSCEMARSRFPRIFSFSASARTLSCCLICVVIALVTTDTASITRNVSG